VSALRIVEPFDEHEDCVSGLGLCLEATAIEQFAFQGCEEALAHGVMGWTPPGFTPLMDGYEQEERDMQMLAIDLAKLSFHIHGVSLDGVVVSRRVGRSKLMALVDRLAPAVVAMEACATAHYWARQFLACGRDVRLINPRFVKPFVRGSKNDAVDAEAIFDAASRPPCVDGLCGARERLMRQAGLCGHVYGLSARCS
jgi:hypothetical protein